jgi:hypothetical protein
MTEERFPVAEQLEVVEGTTIYKTDKWWSAVLVVKSFGRKQIAVYLWNKKGDEWKRRQKFMISSKENWAKIRETVEKYLEQNRTLKP